MSRPGWPSAARASSPTAACAATPCQRLHELEALSLGIAGKLALWEALGVVPAVAEQPDVDLAALAQRAADQRTRVEAERLTFARVALALSPSGLQAVATP